MTDSPRRLTIAVLTYHRPDDLAEILPLLVEQATTVSGSTRPRVLVVDNDPDAGARAAVTGFPAGDIPVVYAHEPEPGISQARNRALSESADSDLLVFIDDDERPRAGWLVALLRTLDDIDCAAVVGPVVSSYAIDPEPWIVEGRFFERRRLATGTFVEVAATNNLLLDLTAVRAASLRFDPAFGITGGDDTMFTRQLVAGGGRIVWCDEAVVVDVVPRARLTRRWVVQRAYSSGNGWSLVSLALESSRRRRLALRLGLTAKGLLRLVGGVVRVSGGVIRRDLGQRARGVRTIARGAGMISGAWGSRYQEYRRADG